MSKNETVGVILAAGLGSRLRPSTLYCPKPLIPVAGVEPLFFALNNLAQCGVTKVIVNAYYLHEMMFAALGSWENVFPDLEIRVSNESSELLGTGGALLKIIEENQAWIKDCGLLVQNGDTLANFPLSNVINESQSSLAVSYDEKYFKKYGPLLLDEASNWLGLGKGSKKSQNEKFAHFLGIHYLSPKTVSSIPQFCGEIRSIDLFNGIYRPLVNHNFSFKGISYELEKEDSQSWFDITNKEYLLEAQHYLLKNAKALEWDKLLIKRYPNIKEVKEGVWFSSEQELQNEISLASPCVFVDLSASPLDVDRLSLGAGSCWIQEKALNSEGLNRDMVLTNSTVLLKKGANNTVPSRIINDVFLA